MKYITVTTGLTVLPECEPIFSEYATTVTIEDEAAGPYVVARQDGRRDKDNGICITPDEWPELREAIEAMVLKCGALDAERGE